MVNPTVPVGEVTIFPIVPVGFAASHWRATARLLAERYLMKQVCSGIPKFQGYQPASAVAKRPRARNVLHL